MTSRLHQPLNVCQEPNDLLSLPVTPEAKCARWLATHACSDCDAEMSQTLAQICRLLIEDIYGPFLSEIFSTLTTYGRLPAGSIAQRCRIPLRQTQSGLGALLQLRLIFHHSTLEGPTIYEANTKAAYNLIRTGKIVQLAHRRFGAKAAKAIQKLLALGQASVANLETSLHEQFLTESKNPANEAQSEDSAKQHYLRPSPVSSTSIRQLIHRLSEAEFIVQVRDSHFQTRTNTRQETELHIRSSEQPLSAKAKQAQQMIEDKTDAEMEMRVRASLQERGTKLGTESAKRRALDEDSTPFAKRPRVGDYNTGPETTRCMWGTINGLSLLRDDLIVCVNFGKVVDALRDEKVALLVTEQSGILAGHVYTTALQQLQGVMDPSEALLSKHGGVEIARSGHVLVNVDQLLLEVNARDFPTSLAWLATTMNGLTNTGNETQNSFHNGHVNSHSPEDHILPVTPESIEQQLNILSEGDCPFIFRDKANERWTIDTQIFSNRLLNAEIFHYARNRFGLTALRLIKILADKGKVEEKWLQEIGLLSAKDLRQSLAGLHSSGLIELQEIPREPQRQPNRTMFLWFYDSNRAQKMLLNDTYRSMAKLLQRMKLERRKLRSTLEKVERSDVKGKEEALLASEEMSLLKRWKKRERWLLAEMSRLDESVVILSGL